MTMAVYRQQLLQRVDRCMGIVRAGAPVSTQNYSLTYTMQAFIVLHQ